METHKLGPFSTRLVKKSDHSPLSGQIELTYRCGLNCVHCYCKGSEDKQRELSPLEFKRLLDDIHKEGCLYLGFTGGEPLIREDFLEIYSYAKAKGFIITLLTSGQLFTSKIMDFLAQSPPCLIEITLNGITKDTYESITGIKGSFLKVMQTIRLLEKRKLKLVLKANCLKQNKDEIGKIKAFTESLLGRPSKNKYYFKYDPMIYPRLNGDKTPTRYRLSFEELLEVRKQDGDLWREYQKDLHNDLPEFERQRTFLYYCNSWRKDFYIDPYGRLKFCQFSDKFSVDLRSTSFKEGFYKVFPKLLEERFRTNSKCKDCRLRPICYYCPARAYLEVGNEEAPVPYYCELARDTEKQMRVAGTRST